MKFRDLHRAMLYLDDEYGASANYQMFYDWGLQRRNQIESAAHELAHGACLGFSEPVSSETVESTVSALTDRTADNHEFSTLRVEVAALRRLGLRVDGIKIMKSTSYRLGTPSVERYRRPLTKREKRAVDRVVRWVREANRERKASK